MDLSQISFFDLHCDTIWSYYNNAFSKERIKSAVSIEDTHRFAHYAGCFAVWIKEGLPKPFETAKKLILFAKEKLFEPCCGELCSIESPTVVLTIEGGSAFEGSPEKLRFFYDQGVCATTLTWNGENELAGGVNTDIGLKSAGVEIIREMNSLSMALDLSHLNKKSFNAAIEIAEHPFVSHTASAEICSHKRNIDLSQVRAVAEKNGIIGICFYPEFLGGSDIFESIYRQINFFWDADFCDNIALGSDFDGAEMSPKLSSLCDIEDLMNYLIWRGCPQNELNKLFYKNAQRFFSFAPKYKPRASF